MKYQISELMKHYGDDQVKLESAHITSSARIRAMTMEKLGLNAQPVRRPRKITKTILIAAVLVLAMTVTAAAVIQHRVSELMMDMPEGVDAVASAVAEAPSEMPDADTETVEESTGDGFYCMTTEAGIDLYYYSLAGYDKQSPEYKAQQEWLYAHFYKDWMHDARDALPQSDPHRLYIVGYENMAEELDAIAEEYGLELARASYDLTGTYYDENGGQTVESLCDTLGVEPFVLSDLAIHTGVLYDEGSFTVNGDLTVPGLDDTVFVNFYCAMDGTMPVFNITGEAADGMEYDSITTADGTVIDLGLGENHSLIFVTADNCHFLIEVLGGCGGAQNDVKHIGMEELTAIANCFDYEKVARFDRAERAETIRNLFAETLENNDWMNEDPGSEARETFDLLGEYGIAALPENYYLSASYYSAAEDSTSSIWGTLTGGASSGIHLRYRPSGDDSDLYLISLNYGRYWQDADMTEVNNRLGFEPEYVLMDEVEITDCTVNGCEAWYFADSWVRTVSLFWLDADRELVFNLIVPDSFTPEQAIAMAESVSVQ